MAVTLITPIFLLTHFENAQFVVNLQTRWIVSAQIVSRFGAVSLPWKTVAIAQQLASIVGYRAVVMFICSIVHCLQLLTQVT